MDPRRMRPQGIEIKTPSQVHKMRLAAQLASYIREFAGKQVKEGRTTNEIDLLVHQEVIKQGAYPSPLLYSGFPKSVCTSVNQVVCHGVPDERRLEKGDILNIDVSVYTRDGVHGDCSAMFVVGETDPVAQNLIETTLSGLKNAIRICGPGVDLNAIGNAIADTVEKTSFTIVESFCGHGIGEDFHIAPFIFHFRDAQPTRHLKMKEGMIFTIEPMVNEGTKHVHVLSDDWTVVTDDGLRSAQFEQMVLITSYGVEVLTKH